MSSKPCAPGCKGWRGNNARHGKRLNPAVFQEKDPGFQPLRSSKKALQTFTCLHKQLLIQ